MIADALFEHDASEHQVRDKLFNLALRQATNESDFQISFLEDKKSRLNNKFTQGVNDKYLMLSLALTLVANPNSKCCEYLTSSIKPSKWETTLFLPRGFKRLLEFS